MSAPQWTPEMEDTLVEMWDAGKTAGEIAKVMERTRNAVIGKLSRLGIIPSGRADIIAAKKYVGPIAEAAERIEVIGDATLIQADCLKVLPLLGKVDAVVTDPPYGIGEARGKNKSRSNIAVAKDYGISDWDDRPCSPKQIALMRGVSAYQVIFGGNYFELPPASCWLVWDKLNGDNDFADCELAWTNLKKAVRRIQYRWNGMLRQNNEPRGDHPTQKPVGVMQWCIGHLPPDCNTILDPFMGSGTTGVACLKLGRRFIGIEVEPKYFDIAVSRIREAHKQPDIFLEAERKATQSDFLTDLIDAGDAA